MLNDAERAERQRKYEAELGPVIAAAAPEVTAEHRVLLGWVHDLVPSHTDEVHRGVPEEDRLWYEALGAVAHRYGLTYEMIGDADEATLWLIPPPGVP